jgi:hypothetical protein
MTSQEHLIVFFHGIGASSAQQASRRHCHALSGPAPLPPNSVTLCLQHYQGNFGFRPEFRLQDSREAQL